MLDILQQSCDWMFPRICVCCSFNSGNSYLDLCIQCKNNLPWITQRCYNCGLQLELEQEAIVCEKCRDLQPAFDCLYALFEYAAPLPRLINQLKFSRVLSLGSLLGFLLSEAVLDRWYRHKSLPEVIIPVPLHEKRLRQRGYNQVLEICIPVAKIVHIPIRLDLCTRVKYTKQQTRLDKKQRIKNLDGAFIANSQIFYKHIAIVDDVVTTGSTARALSAALRAAGVETIDVWCICRA